MGTCPLIHPHPNIIANANPNLNTDLNLSPNLNFCG